MLGELSKRGYICTQQLNSANIYQDANKQIYLSANADIIVNQTETERQLKIFDGSYLIFSLSSFAIDTFSDAQKFEIIFLDDQLLVKVCDGSCIYIQQNDEIIKLKSTDNGWLLCNYEHEPLHWIRFDSLQQTSKNLLEFQLHQTVTIKMLRDLKLIATLKAKKVKGAVVMQPNYIFVNILTDTVYEKLKNSSQNIISKVSTFDSSSILDSLLGDLSDPSNPDDIESDDDTTESFLDATDYSDYASMLLDEE